MPNSAPPMAAPDKLPRAAIWRALLASNAPSSASNCVAPTAVAKAKSHTVRRPPVRWLRANSMTAARRQKRERWVKAPKAMPITAAPSASVAGSPSRSIRDSMDMGIAAMAAVCGEGRQRVLSTLKA